MSRDPLSDLPDAPPPAAERADLPLRRDALPPWAVALLVLFLAARLYSGLFLPWWTHRAASSSSVLRPPDSAGLDSDSLQDLMEADLLAKTAFVSTLAHVSATVTPDAPTLRNALQSAERLQDDSGNAPSAARRVILLRALLPGQSAGPPLALSRRHGRAPLAAFTTAPPPGTSASDRARLMEEGRLWQTVFQGGRLSSKQIESAAAQIARLPNIRWWRYPALIALYTGQGDLAEAQRYARAARQDALPSLLPFTVVSTFRVGLMLLGLVLLAYLLLRRPQKENAQTVPETELWPTLPPPIADAQRRLGAGDLMAVFVLYLLAQEGIVLLLTGFGVPRVFHWNGLLQPFRPRLALLTPAQRSLVGVELESAVYLLSAALPLLVLRGMARRRGASLAEEIGWSRTRLGANALYGVGGLAIASALMLPVILAAKAVFRHAPDPSNPVIPQIAGASGAWTIALLIGLATVAAPLVEETLFRGVFYQAARLRLGVWPAIVLTGLVFGFIHPVGIAEMLAIGTLGGVFAWMAETRKSLAPSIVAHCLNNLTSTLLLLFILAG